MNQKIEIENSDITLYIKREDLLHPYISGNKYRKLKYNLAQAKKENKNTLLTFGGAFSNHILAVAAAGKENGFRTIGVIRGEELWDKIAENPTLQKAQDFGMVFEFVSRTVYRDKNSADFSKILEEKFGDFYRLPEGGTNDLAIKGCEEILTKADESFDYICCAIGTGGTISGVINCSKHSQQVLGFPALKGDFLKEDICKFVHNQNWELVTEYHFGGYAKVTPELVYFINDFYQKYQIPLDPIYTGKMVYGVFDLIKKEWFPRDSKILLIHTGGLQGIAGMNQLLKQKNQIEINTYD
ncbi:1-aminocyclopropane-1-carboxylate deaminase/D-cysteine desulfhydrase [Flavobacterium sp. IMCC34852]|uniref:1-aminocyclopropane-1-carboxylate deaminase/D-cysteine desulfhydrase n=1 Tax=Flavobacterium rivulicola TaxID=2732161 RepID=A0A7Y3VZ12_9FLAO|nr:pyridoxal-phosphate dependent enzyme [Flavobacterium sp. IMCC34852]NNT72001.1 1-aminocyclopropane-1-carboxylate deaminase/D-cysteine desulfhydrase [Flavobacterium sp. IMCC34852]